MSNPFGGLACCVLGHKYSSEPTFKTTIGEDNEKRVSFYVCKRCGMIKMHAHINARVMFGDLPLSTASLQLTRERKTLGQLLQSKKKS